MFDLEDGQHGGDGIYVYDKIKYKVSSPFPDDKVHEFDDVYLFPGNEITDYMRGYIADCLWDYASESGRIFDVEIEIRESSAEECAKLNEEIEERIARAWAMEKKQKKSRGR